MNKRSWSKKFKTTAEMDAHLEKADLSEAFAKWGKLKTPKIRKINLDLPESLIKVIDGIAGQIGVSRQPLLKMWIYEKVKEEVRS